MMFWAPLKTLSYAVALLALGMAQTASANDWAETAATCQRLGKLVTAADIEKIIGKKPVVIAAAVPDQTDGCTMKIATPNAKTQVLSTGIAAPGISINLRQHLSPGKAEARLKIGVGLAGGPDKINELARDARGMLIAFKLFGFDYANAIVDSTEFEVGVGDRALKGPEVAATLGKLVFQRALGSKDIPIYSRSVNEVAGYVVVTPTLVLIQRCLKDDVPSKDASKQAFEASAFKRVSVPPLQDMSDYAQRWIKASRFEEMVAKKTASITDTLTPALESDCARMPVELPALEKLMPDVLSQMTNK
jgi:hypothetical protein